MFKFIFAALAGFAVGNWFLRHEKHSSRRDAVVKTATPSRMPGNPGATPPPGADKRV